MTILIEPVGIETVAEVMEAGGYTILIEPVGIETVQFYLSYFLQYNFNRTSWNWNVRIISGNEEAVGF